MSQQQMGQQQQMGHHFKNKIQLDCLILKFIYSPANDGSTTNGWVFTSAVLVLVSKYAATDNVVNNLISGC